MKSTVLKQFDYSSDGLTARTLCAGDVVEIKDDLAPGLIAAQFIAAFSEPKKVEAPAPVVETPSEFTVKHIGRGRYVIFDGYKRLSKDALTKEEAESALASMRNAPNSENAEG